MKYSLTINEILSTLLLNNKDRFIKALPIDDETKGEYLEFFHKRPNLESEIKDWQRRDKQSLADDIEKYIDAFYEKQNSEEAQVRRARKERNKRLGTKAYKEENFKSQFNRDGLYVYSETEDFLFIEVTSYEGAKFCDSQECMGQVASWCIGTDGDSSYWNSYCFGDGYDGEGECRFLLMVEKPNATRHLGDIFDGCDNAKKVMLQVHYYDDFNCWNPADNSVDAVEHSFEVYRTKNDEYCGYYDSYEEALENWDVDNGDFYVKEIGVEYTKMDDEFFEQNNIADINLTYFFECSYPQGDFCCWCDGETLTISRDCDVGVFERDSSNICELHGDYPTTVVAENITIDGYTSFLFACWWNDDLEVVDLSKADLSHMFKFRGWFQNCSELREVRFPSNLISQVDSVDIFNNCPSLELVVTDNENIAQEVPKNANVIHCDGSPWEFRDDEEKYEHCMADYYARKRGDPTLDLEFEDGTKVYNSRRRITYVSTDR